MKRTFDPSKGIFCPRCKGTHNSVRETRQLDGEIMRVRVCECGQAFVTGEKFVKIPQNRQAITIGSGLESGGS